MASGYENDIAMYLQTNKANEYKGFTAKEITEALDLPTNTAYRVLRSTGFYKSKLPRYPHGYYYDPVKAVSTMQENVTLVQMTESLNNKARYDMEQAKYMQDTLTPIGRVLSDTVTTDQDQILENCGNIKAPKSYTVQEIKDNVAKARNVDEIKIWLVMCLVAANRNLIIEDIKVEE